MAERYASLGSALTIDLPVVEKAGTNFQLKIDYETTEKCTAVQFLKPEYVAHTKQNVPPTHIVQSIIDKPSVASIPICSRKVSL